MQLRLHTAIYTNEQAKLHLAINCLAGDPLDQAHMYVQNDQVNLPNLAAFIAIMETAFGNPNRVAETEHKLNTIVQESRDFTSYVAEFQRYASKVNWDEPFKLSSLKREVSYDIKKSFTILPDEPATIAEYITVCNRIDTRIRQLKNESKPQQQQQQ